MSSATLNLVEVEPGTRLRMRSGELVVVVENPQDGVWLLCRAAGAAGAADDAAAPDAAPVEPVFAQDIEGLA